MTNEIPLDQYRYLEWHANSFAGLILVPAAELRQAFFDYVEKGQAGGIDFDQPETGAQNSWRPTFPTSSRSRATLFINALSLTSSGIPSKSCETNLPPVVAIETRHRPPARAAAVFAGKLRPSSAAPWGCWFPPPRASRRSLIRSGRRARAANSCGWPRSTSCRPTARRGRCPVIADRTDAWNRFPAEPIGAVFLRRVGRKVEALQVLCPHANCSINFEGSPQGGKFFCPCHAASFNLSGQRTDATSPSPRNMDTLDVEIRNSNEVWVKFENFRMGIAAKVVQL